LFAGISGQWWWWTEKGEREERALAGVVGVELELIIGKSGSVFFGAIFRCVVYVSVDPEEWM
jgi:hypothetical protein